MGGAHGHPRRGQPDVVCNVAFAVAADVKLPEDSLFLQANPAPAVQPLVYSVKLYQLLVRVRAALKA